MPFRDRPDSGEDFRPQNINTNRLTWVPEEREYVCDASDLGWTAGHLWPTTLTLIGKGGTAVPMRRGMGLDDVRENELLAVQYEPVMPAHADKFKRLVIAND